MNGVGHHSNRGDDGKPAANTGLNGATDVIANDPFIAAISNGDAYIWSTRHSSSSEDHAFYLRNTSSTKRLRIRSVASGSKSEAVFTLNSVTGDGSGSDSNEFNLDFSGIAADAVHLANAVGTLGTITEIGYRNISDFGGTSFSTSEFLDLGEDDAITVQISKGADDTIVDVTGYFYEPQ